MPQAATPPANPAADAAQAYAAILIEQAQALEAERAEVMERVNANRTELRLIDKQGNLSDDQGAWLDTFYPEKEKGERRDKAAIEATRKAREAARKAGRAATRNGGQD